MITENEELTSINMAFISQPSALIPRLTFSISYTASINFVIIPLQVMTAIFPNISSAAPVGSFSA